MRWRIPFVLTLALFVAVSCDQQPVEPSEDASQATFAKKDVTENVKNPISFSVENPCNSDEVWMEGTDHRVLHIFDNGQWVFHSQYNMKGQAASGVKYSLKDHVGGAGGTPFPESWSARVTVVSSTGVDNFLMRMHYTLNSSGELTADHYAEKCVG